MSNKTIAKFAALVILFALASGFVSSCSHASSNGRYDVNASELSPDYSKPVEVGRIDSAEIMESSGIASSLCQPDVFWTHNDSGGDAFIFAINLKGNHLGTWLVTGARNEDWEDIASYKDPAGTCYLYIGDIGNNEGKRPDPKVYRVKEPVVTPGAAGSSRKNPVITDQADAVAFKYPDGWHNAETLMVQPQTGDIYVLTKRLDGPSLVFKIKPQFGQPAPVQAERVAEVNLPAVPNGLLTGGAIAQDGRRVIVCDYAAGYEMQLGSSKNFDDVWKQTPVPVDLGDRKQGEAVTFTPDSRSIVATSERKNSPVIEVTRK
jgi:hypothetical protein